MSEPTERPVRGRAVLALLGTFMLGLACGGALTVLGVRAVGGPLMRHAPPGPEMPAPMEHMSRALRLDPDQRRAIREILVRDRRRIHALLEETHGEIRELLTPEQRERFDRMRPERRLRHEGPPGRGERRRLRDLPPPGDDAPPPGDDAPGPPPDDRP